MVWQKYHDSHDNDDHLRQQAKGFKHVMMKYNTMYEYHCYETRPHGNRILNKALASYQSFVK